MSQTVLPIGHNLLEILEKYENDPYALFIKVNQIFIKGQYGSTHIVPDSNFSKDAYYFLFSYIYQGTLHLSLSIIPWYNNNINTTKLLTT